MAASAGCGVGGGTSAKASGDRPARPRLAPPKDPPQWRDGWRERVRGTFSLIDVHLDQEGIRRDARSTGRFANFDARSSVQTALAKVGAWLFPFLNVYLFLAYIQNAGGLTVRF